MLTPDYEPWFTSSRHGAGHARDPRNIADYAERAVFLSVEDGFNIKRPALTPRLFSDARDQAFQPGGATAEIMLDSAGELGLPYPATTPLLLASYLRLNAGDRFQTTRIATGEIYVVLQGSGQSRKAGEQIDWNEGDVFCLPGNEAPTHHHAASSAVLYHVSDEPTLRFLGARPPATGSSPVQTVHYLAGTISARLKELGARLLPPDAPGRALNLSSSAMQGLNTCLPSLTLTYNLIAPGDTQKPHRHNAVALVLILQEGSCHSVIAGHPLAWSRHAVVLTPATEIHSHANAAHGEWALALIVQDGGLHYHARTMGFAFA